MSKCKINFKIGEESIPILKGVDSSLIPDIIDQNFFNLIKTSKNWKQLINTLEKNLKEGINISDQHKVEDYNNIIANITCDKLQQLYPQIKFPEQDLSKYKILFVNKLSSYGSNIKFKKSANGEIIYVVDNNIHNVKKLARHLKILESIENGVLNKFDKDSEEIKILNKILSISKDKFPKQVFDIKSLLIHFINNKSKYNNIIIEGEQASYLLNQIIPTIEDIFYKRNNSYKNPIVKNIYDRAKFSNGVLSISYSDLYHIFENSNYNLKYFKNQKDFDEEMSKDEKSQNIINFFNQNLGRDISTMEGSGYDILFNLLFSEERGFPYKYNYSKDGKINFKTTYYKLKDTYGIGYDTILLMKDIPYKNWHIYKNGNNYYVSKYELSEESYTKEFLSLEDAKAFIDKKIKDETFKSSFFIEIHQKLNKLKSKTEISLSSSVETLQKGQVITIKDIQIPTNLNIINPKENMIVANLTIDDFINFVKSDYSKDVQDIIFDEKEKLIEDLNSVYKIGLFLYVLNNQFGNETRTPDKIQKVLSDIKNTKNIYFYIDSINNYSKYKTVKLIKIPKPKTSTRQKYKASYPIVAFWESTAKALKDTFGVDVNIMTQSEIEDKFNSQYSKEKAFIKGNSIYINSTLANTSDLFHEYIHIIMGYMKTNKDLREEYERILQAVWNATENKDKIMELYKGYDFIDILEENFAIKFGEYINGHVGNDIKSLFRSTEILDEVKTTIFDKSPFDLEELGKHPLSEIFSRFSSEIRIALQNNQNMFFEFAKTDQFRLSNRKTNLLKKWIEDGTLKETNCR